jgi:hypothetical protein
MFDGGQNGELASRLLLLLATDMYVRKLLSEHEGPYIRGPTQ